MNKKEYCKWVFLTKEAQDKEIKKASKEKKDSGFPKCEFCGKEHPKID
jgi:hypothetical protein